MGIDVGTTAVKAVVIDAKGRSIGAAEQEYALGTPQPGWAELDPQAVWRAAAAVVRRVTASLAEPVEAVGISALGEAFVPLDSGGRPLGSAIVSFDQRALGQHEEAMRTIGSARFEATSRIRPLPHYAVFKWRWWREQHPDVYERIASFVGLGSFVAHRLGAMSVIDPSLAIRTAVYDPIESVWDIDLVESLGLSSDRLPTVAPALSSAGVVSKQAAERFGLTAGAPIGVGGLDQACGAYDLGVSGTSAMLTIGTTAVVCLVRPSLASIPPHIPAVPNVDGSSWLAMAGTPAGGSVLRWFRNAIVAPGRTRASKRSSYDSIVSEASAQGTSVLFLPHLGGSRVAFDDPSGTGAFVGLTHATTLADMGRAVLDGVAYEVAVLLGRLREGGLEVTELRATGGGSRSKAWMQIISDATGLPIRSTAGSGGSAQGAALLARSLHSSSTAQSNQASPVFEVEPRVKWSAYDSERRAACVGTFEALRATRARGVDAS